jgi:hypothetical protein
MNYRKAVMLQEESIATAGTKVIDFKLKDVISRINIKPKCISTSGTPTAHPATVISKIEIVDGSDVLLSLTGKQARALDFYSQGKPPVDIISYVNDVDLVPMMHLNFGRWLWDTDLAFDPTRFNNPQLKITHNLAAGGIAPDSGTLEVVADCFDEKKPSPVGWLMPKEYYSYTPAASAYEYIDLPTDYPLRMLLLQYLYAGHHLTDGINEIRLSEENDKRIPIDDVTKDLIKYIMNQWGKYEENIVAVTSTGYVTHYATPTYEMHCFGTSSEATENAVYFGEAYGGTFSIKAAGAGLIRLRVSGYLPHGVMAIPFGDILDPSDYYDVTKLGSLELRLKASSSVGGTAQVITEQLRRY